MNNERRKRIEKIIDKLSDLKSEIEDLESEEQNGFDNLPEGLQQSTNGQKMEDAISSLNDATDEIDTVVSSLEEAKS